ncbi:DNA primase large subunit [Methanophagales archaeon]|nr:DNA primase large subunit [Methanophagales archaeon]
MIKWRAESTHLCFYPFLSSASKYVEESGATLENLISSATFERARLRGKARILEAIKDGVIIKPAVITNAQAEMELLSYPFARILVSCIHDAHLVRRYVLSEAKAAHELLLADSSRDGDIIYEMAEEFSIHVDFFREHVQMPFVDYLRFTANLHDKKWKLVNRGLEKGRVKLEKGEFIRIIQEAIYERIMKDLPLNVPIAVCGAIKGYTDDIKRELEETRKKFGDAECFIVKDPNFFPPCITHILSNLKEGINVTHGARFAVTAFLLNLGLTEDEIIEIYKNSPDFEEEQTRYQVRHIAGDMGSVRYTAPSCGTMRTYGNCIGSDDICEKISHPLNYYRLKLKTKPKKSQAKAHA